MKSIIRNFRKRKVIFFTIIASLVIALSSVFVITGYIIQEYMVDSFHEKKDNIYRLLSDNLWVSEKTPNITKEVPGYIKEHFPEVIDYCQWNNTGYVKITANNNHFYDGPNSIDICETSQSFFKMFSFQLIKGSYVDVLSTSSKIVLTETIALKLFGSIEIIGEPIAVFDGRNQREYFVSGIIASPPEGSHLKFDMLISFKGSLSRTSPAYLLLKENVSPANFELKLQKHKNDIPFFMGDTKVNYFLEKMTDIHFTKEVKTKNLIYFIIACLILFVAFFNYINLYTTHIFERGKELLIKRIVGGSRKFIIKSLAFEFSFLIVSSALLSIVCIALILPIFNSFNRTPVEFAYFTKFHVLLGFSVITATLLLLSFFIVNIIVFNKKYEKEIKTSKIKSQPYIGIFQFAVSSLLVICTIVIIRQTHYIHNKDIGLNRDVMEMRLPPISKNISSILKDELSKSPLIKTVSVCRFTPLGSFAMSKYSYKVNGIKKEYTPLSFMGDDKYIETLGIELLQGRNFYKSANQNENKCIINQSMVDFFNLKSPIGKTLPGTNQTILGVVKDFHYTNLEETISPAIINFTDNSSNVLVQWQDGNTHEAIAYAKQCWNKIIQDYPFEFWTIGEKFNQKHKKHEVLVRLITFFCILAIFLSIIGLIARSISTIKHKTKEIGIRKVNGAKSMDILFMLNKNFIQLILGSFILACPIAYYAMFKWLENFAYKTTLDWWIFALACFIILFIALFIINWQSHRATYKNPVEALRYE